MKSNDELRQTTRDFNRFGKKTPRKIHEIKNRLIWISIHGEIKREINYEERENNKNS